MEFPIHPRFIVNSLVIHRRLFSWSGRWTEQKGQKGGKCRPGENYYALIQPGGSTLSDYHVSELDQVGGTYSYDQGNSNGEKRRQNSTQRTGDGHLSYRPSLGQEDSNARCSGPGCGVKT
jgi:hypothetical protein